MATASKAFRARAFDANKSMAIFWSQELPDLSECATGNRAVTQMPSGMEKEEEMESHLQDAILAQQASTSGIQVNHVIPTPKVNFVDTDRYNTVYSNRNKFGRSKYIRVHAWQALEKDEPEYDYDTEDEEWLNDHPHIEAKVLEKIFDTVEANSSETQIASEDLVLNLHRNMDTSTIYEVYEYWLSKRTSVATTSGFIGVGGLIPRVRTECRKDTLGAVNPYVAFRRRAEKMQTRKNRKNDEDSYEKVLKLVHDVSKAKQLFEMTARREKTKLALIDMDMEILKKRMESSDFGSTSVYKEFCEKLRSSTAPFKPFQVNGTTQEDGRKKRKSRKTKPFDRDLVSKAWLKKNEESWNRPPSLFGQVSTSSTGEQTKPDRDAFVDGRYTFKRRRGCSYRAALPVHQSSQPASQKPLDQIPSNMRFYETFLPSSSGNLRSIGFARRRVGRGGRVLFDRIPLHAANQQSSNNFDPWSDFMVADSSKKFKARMNSFGETEDDELNPSERYFARSDRFTFDDNGTEREWISRYRGSWREDESLNSERFEDDDTNSSKLKDCDQSEVERMDVDGNDESQTTERESINGNGIEIHDKNEEEDEEDMDVDQVVQKLRTSTGGKVASPNSNNSPRSGNGIADRVVSTPVPAKMCGTVSDSDEWREPSGSPSESNSSTEWSGFGFKAKIMSVDDDVPSPARPGDHAALSPNIKDAMSTVTMHSSKYILPSTIGT